MWLPVPRTLHRTTGLLPRESWSLQYQSGLVPDCLSQTVAVKTWVQKITSEHLESLLRIWIQVSRLEIVTLLIMYIDITSSIIFWSKSLRGRVRFLDNVQVLEFYSVVLLTSSVTCWVSCAKPTALPKAHRAGQSLLAHRTHAGLLRWAGMLVHMRGLDLEA